MFSISILYFHSPLSMSKQKKYRYRLFLLSLLAFGLIMLLQVWKLSAEADAHWTPEYPKQNLASLLNKEHLSDDDYALLFAQTGLSASAIDTLLTTERIKKIFLAQDALFAEISISCKPNSIISWEEHASRSILMSNKKDNIIRCATIPVLEDGDILITPSSHTYGWRNGHAAIIIDAASRTTLESVVLGQNSCLQSVDKWETYPAFLVLRLKNTSPKIRSAIANNAMDLLCDVPYGLVSVTKQVSSSKHAPAYTHCSHLVWYAYKQAGYNLDSDGGLIVTPNDIAKSSLLEIVQIYGINPHSLLSQYPLS